jgi:hypothetical protein
LRATRRYRKVCRLLSIPSGVSSPGSRNRGGNAVQGKDQISNGTVEEMERLHDG